MPAMVTRFFCIFRSPFRLLPRNARGLKHDADEQNGPGQIVRDNEQEGAIHNHLEWWSHRAHCGQAHNSDSGGGSLSPFFIYLDKALVPHRAQI